MIDPQAKPAPYIKLLALVAVLGLISAWSPSSLSPSSIKARLWSGNKPHWRWVSIRASSPSWSAPSAAWWSGCWSSIFGDHTAGNAAKSSRSVFASVAPGLSIEPPIRRHSGRRTSSALHGGRLRRGLEGACVRGDLTCLAGGNRADDAVPGYQRYAGIAASPPRTGGSQPIRNPSGEVARTQRQGATSEAGHGVASFVGAAAASAYTERRSHRVLHFQLQPPAQGDGEIGNQAA